MSVKCIISCSLNQKSDHYIASFGEIWDYIIVHKYTNFKSCV